MPELKSSTHNALNGTSRPNKYLKGAGRGGEIESGVNVVAKGDTKLGYHQDVEQRKGDVVRDLIARTEGSGGKPIQLNQREALAILTFYNLDMDMEPKQLTSTMPIWLVYSKEHNLYYLKYVK